MVGEQVRLSPNPILFVRSDLADYVCIEVLKFVVSKGISIHVLDRRMHTNALFFCVKAGLERQRLEDVANYFRMLKFLLSKGADATERDINLNTLLHYIAHFTSLYCQDGKPSWKSIFSHTIIPALESIITPTNLDMKNIEGDTPLHAAVKSGEISTCEAFISIANINTVNLKGESALMIAAKSNRLNVDIIRLLTARGADVNFKYYDNNSILHVLLSSESILKAAGFKALQFSEISTPGKSFVVSCSLNQPDTTDSLKEIRLRYYKDKLSPGDDVHLAAIKIECLRAVLSQGANPNVFNGNGDDGQSPLSEAVKMSNIEAVRLLLEHNADVNMINSATRETALHIAIGQKNVPMCKLLIETKGIDLSVLCYNYKSYLSTAIESDLPVVCRLLVEHGCAINTIDIEGLSPLLIATVRGDYETCLLLLDNNADINFVDMNDGETALHLAVFKRNLSIANLLVEKGANINFRDRDGHSCLHAAILPSETTNTFLQVEEADCLFNLLATSEHVNVNLQINRGNTPLHSAIMSNRKHVVRALTRLASTNINITNVKGETALMLAAKYPDLDLENIRALASKTNVNIKDNENNSVLHALFVSKYRAKANSFKPIEIKEEEPKNAAVIVSYGLNQPGAFDSLEEIRLRHYKDMIISIPHRKNHLECLRAVLCQGANPNVINSIGQSPLSEAVKMSNIEAVRLLLEHNADVNMINSATRETALHIAIGQKNVPMCKLLIKTKGIDLNISCDRFKSYLCMAIESDLPEVCMHLLDHNCTLDYQATTDKAPLNLLIEKYIMLRTTARTRVPIATLFCWINDELSIFIETVMRRSAQTLCPHNKDNLSVLYLLNGFDNVKFKSLFEFIIYNSSDLTFYNIINNSNYNSSISTSSSNPNSVLRTVIRQSRSLVVLHMLYSLEVYLDAATIADLVSTLMIEFGSELL